MGLDQPNKRAADQAGKKGKPARKAAASIQSTAGANKPADATAPSSSSSSLLLQVMPHVSLFAAYAVCFVCILFLHLFLVNQSLELYRLPASCTCVLGCHQQSALHVVSPVVQSGVCASS